MKKLLALCLVFCMLLTAFPVTALAEDEFILTDDTVIDWDESWDTVPDCLTYTIENGAVTITDCDDTASGDLVIPAEIEGYPVTTIGASAFRGCASITTVVIPDSVTRIQGQAFANCSGLASVVMSNSVTFLGMWTFTFCTSLRSIAIPETVTSIGQGTFSGCKNISIHGVLGSYAQTYAENNNLSFVPDCLTYTIENGAVTITGCDETASGDLVIPAEIDGYPVTTIGLTAFAYCSALTSVTMPDTVTTVGIGAFYGCTALTSVELSKALTAVPARMFYNCRKLTSITIPDSVTSIGEVAFYDCNALASLTIGNGVTTIGDNAFGYCGLTEVYIPASVTSIAHAAFSYSPKLTTVKIDGGITALEGNVFAGCSALTTITLPSTLKTVGWYTFYECAALTNVYFGGTKAQWAAVAIDQGNDALTAVTVRCDGIDPLDYLTYDILGDEIFITDCDDSFEGDLVIPDMIEGYPVAEIDAKAFDNCTKLTSITLPDSVWCIGPHAFANCSSLASVTFGTGLTRIQTSAFQNCTALKSITIPEGVRTIYPFAFGLCTNLTSVTLPQGLTTIGASAFRYCKALTSITIPDKVTSIGDSAFSYCVSLTEVTIPPSVTTIGRAAFQECAALTKLTIPDGVTNIGADAFTGCPNLSLFGTSDSYAQTYAIENGVSFVPDCLKYSISNGAATITGCDAAAAGQLIIPATIEGNPVTTIGSYAFSGHSKLISVVIPNGVKKIDVGAFRNCSAMETVTIPATVTSIGIYGFDQCASLAHVFFDGSKAQWSSISKGIYNGGLSAATIHYGVAGIPIADVQFTFEYTSAYYKGKALTPQVTATYNGEALDMTKEFVVTYQNNDKVGTATVTVTGINQFEGSATLTFDIAYETIPERIVNVIAIGEIGKISLSWGRSGEVATDTYQIYRKADGETAYTLIKTIQNRDTVTYEDTAVAKEQTYTYYIVGVGEYGASSEPSATVTATVQVDRQAPTILKISPDSTGVISGKTTLSATVSDNVGVTKVTYFYSEDGGNTWTVIGNATNAAFSIVFDTSALKVSAVKVKAIAVDAEGNESDPFTVAYSTDNVGPEQVTGLAATVLSSKITLSWNDVSANDAASFVLQQRIDGQWTTVARNITTLGYTVTGLQAATAYTYRVACVDMRGNVGTYSDAFTATTAADTAAPVITAQGPSASRYKDQIAFYATAKDDCAIRSIQIQTSTDLKTWTTVHTNTYAAHAYAQTHRYTLNLTDYAEGSLFVRAIATDFSGNVSEQGDAAPYVEYIVDKTAPASPQNVTAAGGDGYIEIAWDQGSEEDLGKYVIYRATAESGSYVCIASGLSALNYFDRSVQADVTYYYQVAVTDTCGNESVYSAAVSASMVADTQVPAITGISTTYQQKISPSTHTIRVSASDNNTLSTVTVEYRTSLDAEWVQLQQQTAINSHYTTLSVALPIDRLTDGDTVYLRAVATDMSGLQSDYATATYTVDTTPPTIETPIVSANGSTVHLRWKDGGEEDLAGFKVYRAQDDGAFATLGSRGVNANGVYTFTDTVTAKESGTYTYKIEAIDKLGNTYAWSQTMEYTYVYVNQAPTAHMSIPSYMTVDMEEVFDASASRDDIGIVSYVWDFGDGTTSTQMRPNKKYAATGTYTVTLTVIDTEGISSIITRDVIVKEREVLGTLKVKVTNDGGNALAHVPVYFDLGSADQRIVYTDHAGIATLSMTSGTHTVGMYAAGYLPVKKDVVVLANATRTVTLTTVEEELVTGEFEVTRMTFDEIAAAGIDVYDPANSHVYSATVRVSYTASKSQLNIHYIRNDNQILDYTITDQSGKPVEEYTNDNGETRKIAGVTYLPNLGSGNSGTGGGGTGAGDADVVAIIDIPASASYLKEFFDVRLHIINNASSEFVLEKNEVVLNVPDGMTLMSGVTGGYSSSNTVTIDKIQGQQTVTLAWVLRGDDAGEYDLSADFTGILAEFNQLVTARFETKEPIKVYGLDGVKFRILTADEIHNDTLYFNVELENERDVDIYMPSIGVTDKVRNVTESVLNNDPDKDFSSRAYILNAYLQTGDGKKQYLAVTYDANGKATTDIQVLAPGQKIVYEYVAYNAADCNDPAYFEKAVITEFEGMIENIEVGSFHKNLYSFTDYTEKLDAILNGTDADVQAAYEHIFDSTRYYYVGESEQLWNSICERVYKSIDAVLDFDIDNFTQDEQRAMVESKILSILADSSVVEAVDDLIVLQYCQSVVDIIDDLESELVANYKDGEETAAEIASFVAEAIKDSKELSLIYANEGYEAFVQALNQRLAGYTIGVAVDVADLIAPSTEYISVSKVFDFGASIIGDLYTGRSQAERDAAYFAILKLQCNAEISNYILESLIQATEKDALERLNELIAEGVLSQASPILAITRYNLNEKEMLHVVAKQMQEDLHKSMDDYRQNWEQIKKTVIQVGGTILEVGVDIVLEKMIGATPIGLIKAAYTIADSLFGCENYYQQMDTMQVDNELSKALILSFQNSIKDRNINTDFYSMLFLRALCETRLSGESQFKSFMDDYINGEYLYARDEEAVLRMINDAMGTGYFDYGAWYDTVMRNIVRSRDVLFNIENTVTPEQPAAPSVTLNYDRLTTVQTFSAQYEYAFADGEWQACDNAPIAFEVGNVPGILQVRKAATDTTLAGKITTVTIFAKKELSKLISARFDGSSYWLSNLSAAHTYELFFADSPDDTPDWAAAITVAGDTEAVQISGVGAHDYLFIRTAHNAALQETASYPRTLTVVKKQALQLQVIGDGIVTQTAADGTYFVGETVELTATAADGERFLGWYIGGECVSTDATYLVEMATDLHVSAQFTENTVLKVSVNNATSGIQVSWTVIGTAIEYGVYQRELADGVWSDWQFVAATTNQRYTVSNTQNGVSYEYKVVALIGGVETGSTTSATVKRVPTPTLTVANGQNGIELSWSVNGTPDESYVYRSEYVDGAWTSWKRIDTTTAFAYTDTAVKNGTKYRYMVRVSVDGLLSSANSGTILQRLNAISPTIENTVSGIKLSWRAHAFASKYFLYRSEWVDGAWTDWSRLITTTDLVYTDLSVKNGVQYRYTVMAVSGEYRSSYTPDAEMIRLTVSSLAATNQTKGIQVQWTENAAADKYYLYRSAYVDDAWTAWEKLCDTDDTAYLDTAAENGVKYRYMVRSVHGDQLSGAKTGDILHRLEASTITMENVPSGIKLSWTANDAASKYFIYRSAYIDGVWTAWERFITTTASTTSYTDYSVTNGVQYRYMVRTMKADDQSIAKAGDPMLRLTTPTVKPTAAANGISLSWTANPYAAKYDLYRRAYDVSTGTYLDWERIVENTKATTYTDTTATKGVTYQYTLRAINVTSISAVKAGANVKW